VPTRGRSIERRCFASDGERAVMPASAPIPAASVFAIRPSQNLRAPGLMAHVLGDTKLHAIAASRCY